MKSLRIPITIALALLTAGGGSVSTAQAQVAEALAPVTLEDIHDSSKFNGRFFSQGRWADEGPVVLFIEADDETEATHVVSFDLETDQRVRIIDGTTLLTPDTGKLINIEGYDFSKDETKVLLYTDSERVWRENTKGYYYVLDVARGTLHPISLRDKGFQMFAKFNTDATKVAFVRDRNLFVVDLVTMEERQLTFDGADGTIINGTFDWVYEEEFGLQDGWAWSPDGRTIAFFKLDESNTRDFAMTDLREHYPEYVRFRYPKAGEANSEVQIGTIDVETGETQFFDTDTWYEGGEQFEYIARMGWTPEIDGSHKVWIFRMNRDQNKLDLLFVDPISANVRTVLHEEESTWIDVGASKLTFLDDGDHFVWSSESSGFNHLYLYENSGNLVAPITSGPWDVAEFAGVDEKGGIAFFTASIDSPMERQLYSISVPVGASEARTSTWPVRVTQESGWHSVNMSADRRYFVDTHSSASSPSVVTLRSSTGDRVKTLEANEELIELLESYAFPVPEFMTIAGADGTALNAYLIKPRAFDPKRTYPLLLYVYGGPGSQTVVDAWGGSRQLWHAYLADQLGIIVASVDNRGTGARGKAFKSVTYKHLGQIEAEDHIAAAKYLGALPYVDAERLGIWGWSYGGYMTLMSMLYADGPATFRLGVSVAPVTDWRLYDTIYTERYMSTPQRNEAGYREGSPQTYAANLREDQKLLIVHGDFDDNVHFQNTVQMVDALQAANKQFDLMMYPGRNHGIFGGKTRLHLFTMITNYLRENL